MERSLNVLGQPLAQCGTRPMTGFFRDGYCNTGPSDSGTHVVAAVVSDKWLSFSAARGNDLRPILSPGCSWCLCVSRWKESLDAYRLGQVDRDTVPKIKLDATHQKALQTVSIDDLREFAIDTCSDPAPAQGGPIR